MNNAITTSIKRTPIMLVFLLTFGASFQTYAMQNNTNIEENEEKEVEVIETVDVKPDPYVLLQQALQNIEETTHRYDLLNNENKELTNKLEILTGRITEQEQEKTILNNTIETNKTLNQQEIKELREKIEANNQLIQNLENAIEINNRVIVNLEQQIKDKDQTINELSNHTEENSNLQPQHEILEQNSQEQNDQNIYEEINVYEENNRSVWRSRKIALVSSLVTLALTRSPLLTILMPLIVRHGIPHLENVLNNQVINRIPQPLANFAESTITTVGSLENNIEIFMAGPGRDFVENAYNFAKTLYNQIRRKLNNRRNNNNNNNNN